MRFDVPQHCWWRLECREVFCYVYWSTFNWHFSGWICTV